MFRALNITEWGTSLSLTFDTLTLEFIAFHFQSHKSLFIVKSNYLEILKQFWIENPELTASVISNVSFASNENMNYFKECGIC